jgi:membrane protease subunit HflK
MSPPLEPPPAAAPKATRPPQPPPPRPESSEDASAQALAEALRSSFLIVRVIMILLVAVFLFSGFFTVGPQEKALILRLGRPVAEDESALLGPGPHWAFPYPIDEPVRIPLGEVQTVTSTVGWWKTTPAQEAAGTEPPPGPTLKPDQDGYLLTGDGGIVHARATLRYRIAEPGLRYKFDFSAASNAVQHALDNALVWAAASSTVQITRDSTPFREKAAARLDQLIRQQKLGIVVDQLAVEVKPPRQLAADFDRVLQAEVQRNAALADAQQYANTTTNQALAQAHALLSLAQAERKNLVELLSAEAKRFSELLPEYRKNPGLFMALRRAEALQRLATNLAECIVVQEAGPGQQRQIWLQLSREPQKIKLPEPPKTEHVH